MKPNQTRWAQHNNFAINFLSIRDFASVTCVEMKIACNMVIIWPPTSSSGPCNSIMYEMPNSGISTSSALVAVLYWRVSAVFADLSLIMSTLTIDFYNMTNDSFQPG